MPSHLNVSSPSHTDSLTTNIAKQWTHDRQNTARCLCSSARSSQRNILERHITALPRRFLRSWDAQSNLAPIRRGHKCAFLFGCRQSGQDEPESDCVGAHAVRWSPFLGNRFGQARDACFGQGVIGLTCVTVQAGCTGDVDDVARFAIFDAEEGGRSADELEGSGVV